MMAGVDRDKSPDEDREGPERVPLGTVAWTFLRLGAVGFGGPTAHIALMQEELVERRRWIPSEMFMDALGVTNLIPGPNSSELAIHSGYMVAGWRGALVAGTSFAFPAIVIMTALSAAYFTIGGFELRQDLFAGLQPVVIAVLAVTLWRLRKAVASYPLAFLGAAVAALTVFLPGWEPVWLLAAGAVTLVLGTAAHRRSRREERGGVRMAVAAWLPGLAAAAAGAAALPAVLWVFLKTGALLFGGGYVLIPLLEPEVVGRGWLTRSQFLDGIALGQATPGPIVTASAFVGYGVAGLAGAVLATVAIYVPSFVAVMAGTGPFLRSFRSRPAVRAFVSGVNAAAVGAIAGAGIVLGRTALASPLRAIIGVAAAVALVLRVPIWATLLGGAAVSLAAGALD